MRGNAPDALIQKVALIGGHTSPGRPPLAGAVVLRCRHPLERLVNCLSVFFFFLRVCLSVYLLSTATSCFTSECFTATSRSFWCRCLQQRFFRSFRLRRVPQGSLLLHCRFSGLAGPSVSFFSLSLERSRGHHASSATKWPLVHVIGSGRSLETCASSYPPSRTT